MNIKRKNATNKALCFPFVELPTAQNRAAGTGLGGRGAATAVFSGKRVGMELDEALFFQLGEAGFIIDGQRFRTCDCNSLQVLPTENRTDTRPSGSVGSVQNGGKADTVFSRGTDVQFAVLFALHQPVQFFSAIIRPGSP